MLNYLLQLEENDAGRGVHGCLTIKVYVVAKDASLFHKTALKLTMSRLPVAEVSALGDTS